MRMRGGRSWVLALLALGAAAGWAVAGEGAKKGDEPEKKADEPKEPTKKGEERAPDDWLAKVDGVFITRDDVRGAQRQFMALNPQATVPSMRETVDQLIERLLWLRYFQKQGHQATGAEVTRRIQEIDNELRQRYNLRYDRWIAALGLTAEEHGALLAFEISAARLRAKLESEVQEDEIKREFDAHPEWFDGSRVRIQQIFIDTSQIGHDPEKLKKAKDLVDKVYGEAEANKDFGKLAEYYSQGAAHLGGGDRGWFTRKNPRATEDDEPLMAAAWALKVGQHTKPVQTARGWHVLKVTDREEARLTRFGARPNVIGELIRRRVTAILDELKAKATIVRNF